MRPKILVVGTVNTDFIVKVDRQPLPGENVYGHGFQTTPGGKGLNQAAAASRLGADATLSARLGYDYYGDHLLSILGSTGIDTSSIERDTKLATGIAIISIDSSGENSIIIATGANGNYSVGSVEKIKKVVKASDIVLCQLELPLDPIAKLIDMAIDLDKPVILDAGPPCISPRKSFFKVDILTPNKIEAEALSGIAITDRDSAFKAAYHLLEKGPKAIILKLGSNGALLVTSSKEKYFLPHKVEAVDATAAGDAFSAALAVSVVEGRPIEDAIEFANAAGALAVTRLGALNSLPTRKEVEKFLQKI